MSFNNRFTWEVFAAILSCRNSKFLDDVNEWICNRSSHWRFSFTTFTAYSTLSHPSKVEHHFCELTLKSLVIAELVEKVNAKFFRN